MKSNSLIRAELAGDDSCSALGIIVRSSSPVLALCRKLVDAGHDPATPLEAYRGDTLALRVKSIGHGAQLRMGVSPTGSLIFKRKETCPTAPPVSFYREAAE
jgi:hypothetical protein